jgi:hypothetical protein
MLVRSPVRFACALALIASSLVCCTGCKWVKFVWEEEEPPPRPYDPFEPDYAQMWENGYGYGNPNGAKIRSGEKKPGDKPTKANPYYYMEMDKRREYHEKEAAKPEFIVQEPEISFD